MTNDTKPAKPKSRALPVEPNDWTPEHDLVVFRRVQRLLAEVPYSAMYRMRGYLHQLLESAGPDQQQRAQLDQRTRDTVYDAHPPESQR
jgi:hypothetical protein